MGRYITIPQKLQGRKIILREQATAPSEISDKIVVYAKDDGLLYYKSDDGTERELKPADLEYAEMYIDNNGTATTIETAGTPILMKIFTEGLSDGFTFSAGKTGSITAYADYSGTVAGSTSVTSTAHDLSTGDIISIRGTTNYNGVYEVTVIDANTFYIMEAFVADDGASDWEKGDQFTVGQTGKYQMDYNISFSEGGAAGSLITTGVYINTTACSKSVGYRKLANNDYGSISAGSILELTAGDILSFFVQSSGTNDITAKYGNIRIKRS